MPKGYLFLDLETRSNVDLTLSGVYRYAQDPATDTHDGFETLLCAYSYVSKRQTAIGLWARPEQPAMPRQFYNFIGWVGVITPHVARIFVGASFPRVAIASFLIGSFFLLLIDDIVRGVPGVELPLGVLTALVGTPFFLLLLSQTRKGWG